MTQGGLGFKYEEDKSKTGMTGVGGMGLYLDLIARKESPKGRQQRSTHTQTVNSGGGSLLDSPMPSHYIDRCRSKPNGIHP